METKDRKISELKPAAYNPRKITETQFNDLKASLKKFESVEPAVVNMHPRRKNVIIGGHMRLKAAAALGWKSFPCVHVKLTPARERELNIRYNEYYGTCRMPAL
ncbi:MAG: ParB N-terminal domain-containing protein [Candidatus Auribacterota bacterium]|nr:ParB N-terminal domain-containing protein [Candidatus Auribacterota bacterium]